MASIDIPVKGTWVEGNTTSLLLSLPGGKVYHLPTIECSTPYRLVFQSVDYFISGKDLMAYEEEWVRVMTEVSNVPEVWVFN